MIFNTLQTFTWAAPPQTRVVVNPPTRPLHEFITIPQTQPQNLNAPCPITGLTPLTAAVRANDSKMIEQLIAQGANPDFCDASGHSPLTAAIFFKKPLMFWALKKGGANLNLHDRFGHTPLTRAVYLNNAAFVRVLTTVGCDLNAADGNGFTPLTTAVHRNSTAMVRLLAELKANLNQTDRFGHTPLTQSVFLNKPLFTTLLAKLGADDNARDALGFTPLTTAIILNMPGMIRLLQKLNVDLDLSDAFLQNPLTKALRCNFPHLIRLLVELGANTNSPNLSGQTALMAAIELNLPQMVQLLCSLKADPNQPDGSKYSPLTRSVALNNAQTIMELKQANADFNRDDGLGEAPLTTAIRLHPELAPLLVKLGALVNSSCSKGHTPLTQAIELNRLDTVRQLKDLGADFNHLDLRGYLPITVAVQHESSPAMIELVVSCGANLNISDGRKQLPLTIAARKNHVSMIQLLQELGADLDFSNADGQNPVTTAVESESESALIALSNFGADIDEPDARGYTPASTAVLGEKHQMLRTLYNLYADFYRPNKDGTHAVTLAAREKLTNVLLTFKSLETDFHAFDENVSDPLDYAHDKNDMEMARLLVKFGVDVNSVKNDRLLALANATLEGKKLWRDLYLSLGADSDFYDEWQLRKELAHAWDIPTQSTYKTKDGQIRKFYLHLYSKEGAYQMMKEFLDHYLRKNAFLWKRREHILKNALTSLQKPATTKLSQVNAFRPVLVYSGSRDHFVCYGIWKKNKAFLVNRGEGGDENNPITFYRPSYVDLTLLSKMEATFKTMEKQIEEHATMHMAPNDGLKIPLQKGDNCAWSSLEGAFAALFHLMGMPPKTFKNFDLSAQEYFLNKYLTNSRRPDEHLLKLIARKIETESQYSATPFQSLYDRMVDS